MAKYVSGRQKNLKVGISSYSENLTSIEVIGNVGIATTNATSRLYVVGDGYFTGIITASNFYIGGNLVSGGSSFTQITVSGITTLGVTSTTNLTAQQLTVSGISTLGVVTAGNIYSTGVVTATTFSGTLSGFASSAGISTFTSEWILGAIGSSDYTFTGPGFTGAESDPVLYLVRGQQYKFTNTMGMHPFRIQSTVNGSTGTQYDEGIANNNVSNGTLTWNVQFDAPSLLYYQCTAHAGMGGKIYIIDAGIGSDISINTTGIITASSFSGNASSATYATNAGIATYATNAGVSTYATNAGIATYATNAGVSTYATNAGIATYATNAGIATYATNAGVSTYATNAGIATYATNAGVSTYATNAGIATYATNAGIATYATNAGIATYATNAGVATALQNSRTFEITGDIVGSPISFDGTGNVSIAATIQPNSVALGSDTIGDYVQSISGTANQITVTGGTGEGSTPTLSIPSQFTAPQDVTVARDLQVNRNLNVNGNITIGGTSATLFSQTLSIFDPDIVLGYRTDAFGNDVSNDSTANHGGVALASTEGTPLVDLFIADIETNPPTYKKIMWFKAGTFAGLGTDAWLFNYAVGIGSTQFPTGTRLAVGGVQFTENDLAVVRNINASGVVTAATLNSTVGIITNLTGVAGTITNFNATVGIITNLTGINLNYSGISTFTNGPVLIGTATSTGTASQRLQVTGGAYFSGIGASVGIGTTNPTQSLDVNGAIRLRGALFDVNNQSGTLNQVLISTGSGIDWVDAAPADAISGLTIKKDNDTVGSPNSVSSINFISGNLTATASGVGATITLTDNPTFTGVGIGTTNPGATLNVVPTTTSIAGLFSGTTSSDMVRITQLGTGNALVVEDETNPDSTPFVVTGIGSVGIGTTNPTSTLHVIGDVRVSDILTANRIVSELYGEFVGGSISGTNIVGTSLSISGISTFTNGPVLIGTATSTGTASQRLQVTGGAYFSGIGASVGIGTTNPTSTLTVVGGASISGLTTTNNLYVAGVGTFLSSGLKIRNSANTFNYIITGGAIAADRTLNLPIITTTDTVAVLGFSQTFTQTQTFSGTLTGSGTVDLTGTAAGISHNFGTNQTTSTLTFGGTSGTGTITLGRATTSQTTNIQAGVTASGNTKTINFGTLGATGSFTQINIGPTAGVGTVVINSGTNLLIGTETSTGTASQRLQVTGGAYFSGIGASVGIGTTNPTSTLTVVGNGLFSGTGIVTATTFVGALTGTATTATNLSDAANITTGTINSARLSGTYDINVSYANTAGIATIAQGLTGTPNITVGIVTATSYNGSGTNLTGIVTSIVAGTNITVSGSNGQVTINAAGGLDILEVMLFA